MGSIDELPLHVVENEYGVSHLDYWTAPPAKVVRRYVEDYNIATTTTAGKPVSPACLNCQIAQIERYKDSNEYAIRRLKTILRQEPKRDGKKEAELRKGQLVTLLQRKGTWCKVQTTTIRGQCIEDAHHDVIYSDDREMLEQSTCRCGSRYRVISERKDGWVLWDSLTFFKCPCTFFPAKYELPKQLQKELSIEEQEQALVFLDPVRWVREWLGMEPRDNQKLNLMCTSKNIVLREGRRAGKTWGEVMTLLHYILTTEIPEGTDTDGNPVFRGPEVLVATPFLSQIELIFGIIDKMVTRNKEIKIKRRVKTPFHTIEFSNGGKVEGFTTGTQSKQEAGTVLGQAADLILLDEVDRMDSSDIVRAIRPIQITSPHVRMMSSSTPTGKREWFYNRCMNDHRFKEFYFPSTIISHWEEVKEEAEAEGTQEFFLQEYMAVFTAQISGVYQPAYIAAAESSYAYNQPQPYVDANGTQVNLSLRNPAWKYTMGVDWNTNAGTEILVVGMDPITMHCWVVDVENVGKQDWQQTKAVETVFKMNAKWTPDYIYVDRGYGGQQIEIMQRMALEASQQAIGNPAALLVTSLYAYDFGSKIEYRDPMTGTMKKTNAKAFLVENSVRRFEERRIHFSARDPFLTKQLLNYIVDGVSPAGVPRYGMNSTQVGDHRLDALNLALVPFRLHLSDFAPNGKPVTSVGFTNFGSGMTRTVDTGDEKGFEEFMANIPRNKNGAPAFGGRILLARPEPGYVEKKRAEGYNEVNMSRTAALDAHSQDSVPEYRYGWSSDTEWKEKKKYAPAKIVRRTHKKPRRRTF